MAKQGYFTRGKIEFWVLFLIGVMFFYVYETQRQEISRLEQKVHVGKLNMLISARPEWFDLERSRAGGSTNMMTVMAVFHVKDEQAIPQIREIVGRVFSEEDFERIGIQYYVDEKRVEEGSLP